MPCGIFCESFDCNFDRQKNPFQQGQQGCDADTPLKDRVVQRDTGRWIPVMMKVEGASMLEFSSSHQCALQIIIFYVHRVRILRGSPASGKRTSPSLMSCAGRMFFV